MAAKPLNVNKLMHGRHLIRKLTVFALMSVLAACVNHPPAPVNNASLETYFDTWQGTPYRLGGSSHQGLDCSAFVKNTYREVYRLELPRATRQQAKMGVRVRKANLQRGDLVFFKTGWRLRHVGIYTENGKFIHASTRRGVIESSLNEGYWDKHYWKARRIY